MPNEKYYPKRWARITGRIFVNGDGGSRPDWGIRTGKETHRHRGTIFVTTEWRRLWVIYSLTLFSEFWCLNLKEDGFLCVIYWCCQLLILVNMCVCARACVCVVCFVCVCVCVLCVYVCVCVCVCSLGRILLTVQIRRTCPSSALFTTKT